MSKSGFQRGFLPNVLLRLTLSAVLVAVLYYALDARAIRTWKSQESLVVRLLAAGPETRAAAPSEEAYPMLQRPISILILTGERAGESFDITVVRLAGSGVELQPGRRYLLVQDEFDDGTVQYSIADAWRVSSLAAFVTAVCLVLVSFMGWRGFWALLGLAVSVAILVFGMIPLMARGWPPVTLAFASILVISTVTVACVVRHPRCWTSALLGTLGGACCGFLLGGLMVRLWQLTGLAGEGAALLASTLPGIDMRGILLASILVGSIGAVLDVGISITASMAELTDYDPDIPLGRLWMAGLNVGGEVLGSMINTLILAYLGTSLPMALLISGAGIDFLGLLNDPYIGQELAQSLAGTAGLLLTIPVTASFFVAQEALLRRRQS